VQGADVVVSAPKPRQDTYIGRPLRLRLRHKAGTGTGTYTLVAGSWALYGGPEAFVKSYDISTGVKTPLTETEDLSTISYYYVVADNNGEYPIIADATLQRNDGSTSAPRATARYRAAGPTGVTLGSVLTPNGPSVGYFYSPTTVPNRLGLMLGDAVSDLTHGISYIFTATMPSGDNGYLAGTQLVKTVGSFTLSPTASPPFPRPPANTNGSYWLDGCPIYGAATQAGIAGLTLWTDWDSPISDLTSKLVAASRDDAFRIFLMYRPTGPQSIWVPLGNLSWSWRGNTVRLNSDGEDILLREGWTKPMNAASSADKTGQLSSEFPIWSATVPFDGQCPTPPTQ
jgi:hypothetical protein